MKLIEMMEAVRESLGDSAAVHASDEYVIRGIQQAVQDLSRLYPQEKVKEIVVDYDVSDETIDSGDLDIAVQLANTYLQYGSELVYSAASKTGTLYTKDTDYTMDYTLGQIIPLSTGDMVADTTYYLTYETSRTSVSTATLTDLISIERVEYPMSNPPQNFIIYTLWGDRLFIITSKSDDRSQVKLTAGHHVRIFYLAQHTIPTTSSSGSYERYADEPVILGSSGYVLLFLASYYQRLAAALVSSASDLLYTASLSDAAPGQIYLADTALNSVSAFITGGAADALDAVATFTGYAKTSLDAGDTNADAVEGRLNLADKVADGDALIPSAYGEDDFIDLAKEASGYLETGLALINTVNKGEGVADLYARYTSVATSIAELISRRREGYIGAAQVGASAAQALSQIGMNFISAAQAHNQEANQRLAQGQIYIAEATVRNSLAETLITASEGYLTTVASYLEVSTQMKFEGNRRISEFQNIIKSRNQMARTSSLTSTAQR